MPPGFGGGGSAVDLAAWVRRAQGSGWTLRSGFGERRGRGGPRRPGSEGARVPPLGAGFEGGHAGEFVFPWGWGRPRGDRPVLLAVELVEELLKRP